MNNLLGWVGSVWVNSKFWVKKMRFVYRIQLHCPANSSVSWETIKHPHQDVIMLFPARTRSYWREANGIGFYLAPAGDDMEPGTLLWTELKTNSPKSLAPHFRPDQFHSTILHSTEASYFLKLSPRLDSGVRSLCSHWAVLWKASLNGKVKI